MNTMKLPALPKEFGAIVDTLGDDLATSLRRLALEYATEAVALNRTTTAAVAWQFRDNKWLPSTWAAITKEQYEHYASSGEDSCEVRQLFTTPPAAADVPEGYYIASFKGSGRIGAEVLWWMPNNAGYTIDLEHAGIYSEPTPGYHDNEYTVPVPVSFIQRLRVRRVVDPGDSLNIGIGNARGLRAMLADAPQPNEAAQAQTKQDRIVAQDAAIARVAVELAQPLEQRARELLGDAIGHEADQIERLQRADGAYTVDLDDALKAVVAALTQPQAGIDDGLMEALELPDGYEVSEFLPGIYQYEYDSEDGERMVSGTSWNHPSLAAIAAWQAHTDELQAAQQQAGVVVDEAMVERCARVVAEIAGENFDLIGEFAQQILKDTQRSALQATLAGGEK